MFIGLLPSWLGSLNDVPVDDELKLDCSRIVGTVNVINVVDVVLDWCALTRAVKLLVTLLMMTCSSWPG